MPPRADPIKMPLPPTYHGTRGKADVFTDDMETFFKFSAPGLPEKDKVDLAAYLLRDAARSWFKGAPPGSFPTWTSFKELLTARFALHNAVNNYSDALYNLRQLQTPISVHDQQFENLVLELENVGLKLSDDEAYQRYRQSLNDYYKDKLAEHPDIKTYRAAFEKLEAIPYPCGIGHGYLEPSMGAARPPPLPMNRHRPRRNADFRRSAYISLGPSTGLTSRNIQKREPVNSFPSWRNNGKSNYGDFLRRLSPPPTDSHNKNMANVKCFRCQRNGHYAKNCPMSAEQANLAQ